MRHRDHGAGKLVEIALEPRDGFRVEMVRGLVEQQHVRGGQQQAAQRHPAALATGEVFDRGLPGWQPQRVRRDLQTPIELPSAGRLDGVLETALLLEERVHLVVVERLREAGADLVEAIEQPLDVVDAGLDVAADILGGVEHRLLRQESHPDPRLGPRFAVVVAVHAGHDAQQRRLSGAVQAEHTDLRAGKERQRDVLENLASRRRHLGDAVHGVDVLGHGGMSRRPVGPDPCSFGWSTGNGPLDRPIHESNHACRKPSSLGGTSQGSTRPRPPRRRTRRTRRIDRAAVCRRGRGSRVACGRRRG